MVEHDYTLDDRQTALIRRLRTQNQRLRAKNRELEAKLAVLDQVIASLRADIRDLLRRLDQDDLMELRELNHDLRCRIVELQNEAAELRAKLALTESFQAGEPFLDMVESVNKAEKG